MVPSLPIARTGVIPVQLTALTASLGKVPGGGGVLAKILPNLKTEMVRPCLSRQPEQPKTRWTISGDCRPYLTDEPATLQADPP
jgi:hypothetical protein